MPSDIPTLLAARLRRRPGDPVVAYLDATTGERTELSATSLANAASKIGNAIIDEFDLLPPARIALAMPAHWQFAAWCLGTWLAGCCVDLDFDVEPDALITDDPAFTGNSWPGLRTQVVSRHPFGLPIADPLPDTHDDVTLAIRRQPDAYLHAPGVLSDLALQSSDGSWDQAALVRAAEARADAWEIRDGDRFLIDDHIGPVDAALACAVIPLARDSSIVIVHGADEITRAHIAEQERARPVAAP